MMERLYIIGKEIFDENNNKIVLKGESYPDSEPWGREATI